MPREDVVVVIVGTLSASVTRFRSAVASITRSRWSLLTIAIGCAALALMGLPGRLVGDRAGEAAVVGFWRLACGQLRDAGHDADCVLSWGTPRRRPTRSFWPVWQLPSSC